MAAKKKAKKPLAKKAMKRTKGGAAYIKVEGVDGEAQAGGDDMPTESITLSFGQTRTAYF